MLHPTGLAYDNYMTVDFFLELSKKFSQEKDEEGRNHEYLARKQGSNVDPLKYYTDKLWIGTSPRSSQE